MSFSSTKSFSSSLYHLSLLFRSLLLIRTDNENLGIARLPVEIAAGEQKRVTVQVVEDIGNLELGAVLLKNQDILSIISIKGVAVVRDTVTILVSILIHHGAGFSWAGGAEDIGYVEITPGVRKVG